MSGDDLLQQQAAVIREQAYRHHMRGELADAMLLYKRSLALYPTAEAYTLLGWAYSAIDLYDEAVAMCKKAIELEPDLGNPYNDIGAYLIDQGQWEEAIPWLEQATLAPRYDSPEFAYTNLGRVFEHLGDLPQALAYFERALTVAPVYLPAEWARNAVLGRLN